MLKITIKCDDTTLLDVVKAVLTHSGDIEIIKEGIYNIMVTQAEALQALKDIDQATNEEALALAEESDSLKTVSANITALVAKAQTGDSSDQEILAGLIAQATKVKAISATIADHAAFAKSLATDPTQPVPAPVPPVTVPTGDEPLPPAPGDAPTA